MEDILIEFKNHLKEKYISENTISAYSSDVKQFLKYFANHFGEELISFSRGHVSEFKNYLLKDQGVKYSTINRKIAALSVYEDFLILVNKKEEKSIRDTDFYKIDVPYITADMLPNKTIKKVILKSSIEKPRDYLILVLMDSGGLRVSEVLNIELKRDVDFEMFRIVILGKGNKVRHILMTNIIREALEEYLPEREKMLQGKQNKYLIVSNESANTGKPIHRSLINKTLNKYCEKVNENKIHPHILRHHCATDKYQEGYNDMMLKKTLGQSSNITNRYVHPGFEDEIAQKNRERKNK